MKIVITGTSGFIGSKCMELFQKYGVHVEGWNRTSINSDNEKKIDFHNYNEIEDALIAAKPDVLIHCAGSADVAKSVSNPNEDYASSVSVTHNLLFSIHRAKMDKIRFVFLSSAGVYGNVTALPICESMPQKPMSPYALHKVMCEDICNYFIQNAGMEIIIARIFSAYGSGLKKQIFWDMYTKYKNTGRLEMYGTGNETRDYIHINDVVQAIYLLSTKEYKQTVYNIANGEEIPIRKATEVFAHYLGITNEKITFNNYAREGNPLHWCADISRIQKLGYKKTVSFEDGILDYCMWCMKEPF